MTPDTPTTFVRSVRLVAQMTGMDYRRVHQIEREALRKIAKGLADLANDADLRREWARKRTRTLKS